MIARLEGTLREKNPTRVVLDVAGVGYEILIPLSTYAELPNEGKTVALRIHTHVREDAIQLFGFQTAPERALFELLIRTNGVGPKLAQAILSGMSPGELVDALRSGAVEALRAVPGVGLKTAERIVLELRDRVAGILDAPRAKSPGATLRSNAVADPGDQQVISALVNLGTPRARAERVTGEVLEELGEEASIAALIRAALRRLSR